MGLWEDHDTFVVSLGGKQLNWICLLRIVLRQLTHSAQQGTSGPKADQLQAVKVDQLVRVATYSYTCVHLT